MAITSSAVKIYSDAACQNLVATFNGTTAASQAISITGLSAETTYYARAEATDSNGLTGFSAVQSFATAATGYTWTGDGVMYSSSYDTLDVDIQAHCAGATFTQCGIEFSTNSHFTGTIISDYKVSDDYVDDISGFAEHTTYYYRYFATTTEYGTQYYVPQNNTITTLYDEPTIVVGATNVTDTTANIYITYTGNYPPTNLSLAYGVQGSTLSFVQIDDQTGTQTVTLTGLTPNTVYAIEGNADYYTGEVTETATFATLSARPTVAISSVSNITPSGATVNITIS